MHFAWMTRTAGYFQSHAFPIGYQAGIEIFGCVLFLIGEDVLKTPEARNGSFDLGAAPPRVIADEGFAGRGAANQVVASSGLQPLNESIRAMRICA